MAFDGTGKIYIPNEEFWVFVMGKIEVEDPFIPKNPRIEQAQESLFIDIVKEHTPDEVERVEELDLVDFWAFVEEWHPFAKTAAEYCFGVPQFGDEDVVIEYAVSTVCDPRSWANPPAFIKGR